MEETAKKGMKEKEFQTKRAKKRATKLARVTARDRERQRKGARENGEKKVESENTRDPLGAKGYFVILST